MDKAAAAYRRKNQRHRERCAKDNGAQIARRDRDRATRTKCHRLKSAGVLVQRPFAFRAAVDVVEYHTRKSALRNAPQVCDVQNARRLNRSRHVLKGVWQNPQWTLINTGLQAGATRRKTETVSTVSTSNKAVETARAGALLITPG
jgi:serine/threonine-protein kinase RIO1